MNNCKSIKTNMKKSALIIISFISFVFSSCTQKYNYPEAVTKIDEIIIENKTYDIVTFGRFPQSKNEAGGYNVEPVKWRVAQKHGNQAMLICENVLTGNIPFYENFSDNRTVDGETIYPNNYEYSEIRAYLNGLSYPDLKKTETKWEGNGFLQTAFTADEQELILTTVIDNSEAQYANQSVLGKKEYLCRNTRDKIFLLSKKDIENPELGFTGNDSRIRLVTDYAYAHMAFRSNLSNGIWWVRTPVQMYASRAYVVIYTGEADENKTNRVRDPVTGVVPALWIKLN